MSTRKSHAKSRNGCQTCKKRRVKCDEQGPPCANCVIRKTPCTYGPASAHANLACTSPLGSSSPSTLSAPASESASAAASPSVRRLELELMHHWSTSTYKTVCSLSNEQHLLQILAPRDALRHDYLLDGMFALSALHLAAAPEDKAESAEYARAGLEYYDRGLSAYKAELGSVTPDNYLAIFLFSTLRLAMSLLLPRFSRGGDRQQSARETVSALIDAMLEIAPVLARSWDLLEAGPVETRAWLHQNVPVDLLDEGTRATVVRLHSLNDSLHGGQPGGEIEPAEQGKVSAYELYQKLILHLEGCFARDIDATVKGSCLAWLALGGYDFPAAFRRSEPIALVILTHWGVLLNNLGKEAWWAEQVGKNLVMELSEELQELQLAPLPVWQECIAWAREQVGLPALI